jgi:hypothetical protein
VEEDDPLQRLLGFARQAGIQVREAKGEGDAESGPRSACCRLRGRVWVILVAGDPLEERIRAVAEALDQVEPRWLETHYLPPALRNFLEGRPRG